MLPDVIVTNFKRRVTGVTTTALRVAKQQKKLSSFSVGLCGPKQELGLVKVLALGWQKAQHDQRRIWHVRRNNEMVWGVIARDILRQPIKLVFTSAAIRRHSVFPRWLISRMDGVIATTQKAAAFVPKVKAVIGHGVDLNEFTPDPNRSDDTINLITVGRIRSEKGTDLIVDALCEILPKHPHVKMQFAGLVKKSDEVFYQAQIQKLKQAGVVDQVSWLGEVPAALMPKLLASSHILIASPIYEGFGLTPFEALACKLAILCTDTGAFAKACGVSDSEHSLDVRQGASGLLVNVNDVKSLTSGLQKLIENPKLRNTLATRGLERAHQEFSIKNEAKSIDQVYRQVLEIN